MPSAPCTLASSTHVAPLFLNFLVEDPFSFIPCVLFISESTKASQALSSPYSHPTPRAPHLRSSHDNITIRQRSVLYTLIHFLTYISSKTHLLQMGQSSLQASYAPFAVEESSSLRRRTTSVWRKLWRNSKPKRNLSESKSRAWVLTTRAPMKIR